MICTWLHSDNLRVCVGDSLQNSEEIVKNLKLHLSMRSLFFFYIIVNIIIIIIFIIIAIIIIN